MKSYRKKISRAICSAAILLAAVAALITYMPSYAADTDDRIESAAKDSFVFKTYLKDDNVKIQSKDGIVTMRGTINNQ